MRRLRKGDTINFWIIFVLTPCLANKVETQVDLVGSQVILKIDRDVICDPDSMANDQVGSNSNLGSLCRVERLIGDLISQSKTSQDEIQQLKADLSNQSQTFQDQLDDQKRLID